uniref:unspecific monooxygenase n=1 Tax=Podarcis muralis TaxID=64176 RepID=A0A670I029_PODMU
MSFTQRNLEFLLVKVHVYVTSSEYIKLESKLIRLESFQSLLAGAMEPLGTVTILMIICISCLVFLAVRSRTPENAKQLPPGPPPLPIVGNALQLKTNNLAQVLQEFSEKYGSVFTMYFGAERIVVLHGYDAVKEALIDRGDEFAARGHLPLADDVNKGLGIVFSNGEVWKQLRRFALTTLRNFGMGKKSIEERIKEEAQFLLEKFQDTQEKPLDPTYLLSCALSNVICAIVFGKRYDYNDKKFLSMMSLMNENFQVFSSPWGQLYNVFPSLMKCIPGPHHKVLKNNLALREFVLEEVEEHKPALDPSSPRDFIDCFLMKMDQEKGNSASHFTIENLAISTVDLFAAGTETTSTTLRYGFMILLKYPEIQEKVHEEIDRVIGRSRSPCMADRGEMPYTDAVIHEIQRFISLLPLSIPHAVLKDTPFRQYVIPKGTTIYPILTSVLHDSKEFPNPKEFDPGHFLHKDGTFRKSDYFMPFSAVRSRTPENAKQLPPGPPPLPIVGNALQLKTNNLAQVLQEFGEKYGSVFTMYFGTERVVVLHGYDAVKEALIDRGDEFAARGRLPLAHDVNKGLGIIFSNGEMWKQLRRFILTTLRNFGMGKKSIEERIQEEAQFLLEKFQDTQEKPLDPTFSLSCAISNVICAIIFGKRYDYNDKKLLSMLSLISENFQLFSSPWGQLYNVFPSLMKCIPGPHHKVLKNNLAIREFVLEEVEEHKPTLDPSSPRDFIDCYLMKMDQEKGNSASHFTIENLAISTVDLFGAGTETTSTTLRYGFMILLKYPEIQDGLLKRKCMKKLTELLADHEVLA